MSHLDRSVARQCKKNSVERTGWPRLMLKHQGERSRNLQNSDDQFLTYLCLCKYTSIYHLHLWYIAVATNHPSYLLDENILRGDYFGSSIGYMVPWIVPIVFNK